MSLDQKVGSDPSPSLKVDPDDLFRFERCLDCLDDLSIPVAPGSAWLDLGCNQGQFIQRVLRRHNVRAVGFDSWDPAEKTPGFDDVWDYRRADLSKELPWHEEVETISALETLEHIVDTDGFLKRIFDTLKPGGTILLSTPNINSLRNRLTVPLGFYPYALEYRTIIHHVRLYNAPMLLQHLREIGFERIGIRGVAFLPMSSAGGRWRVSVALANAFPQLCNNIIAIGRKPNRDPAS